MIGDNMKNKGFTLIELLGVIMLLSLLIVLGTSSVSKSIRKSKQDAYDIDMSNFITLVKNWSYDHISELPGLNQSKKVTLQDLVDSDLIENGKKNPLTGEAYDANMSFCIYNVDNNYRYEYRESGSC